MHHRRILHDGIGARRRRQRYRDHHRARRGVHHLQRVQRRSVVAVARRRRARDEGPGQRRVAARTRQIAGQVRGVRAGVSAIAIVAGNAVRQRLIVQRRSNRARRRHRIGNADRQRRSVAVAILVGQRIGERVAGIARRAGAARIGVAAVGLDLQRAIGTGNLEIAVGIEGRVRVRPKGDPGDPAKPVRTRRIDARRRVGRADPGDDITRRRRSARHNRVGVVLGIGTIVLENQVLADVERLRMGVAVAVLGGRGQRDQIVRRKRDRLIRIGRRVNHRALLVERDFARRRIDRYHEDQVIAARRAAFDIGAVEREYDVLARRRIDQPGGASHHRQRIDQRAR